jgi:hypothetical protein
MTAIEAARLIAVVLLPLVGIGLVLFTLAAFITGIGVRLRDQKQEISGFGLDLKVSVLTLFVLTGVTFSLIGTYLIVQDYEAKIGEAADLRLQLTRATDAFEIALRQARQVDVTALISLQDIGDAVPNPETLACQLHLFNAPPRRVRVSPGVERGQYYITLDNLSAGQLLQVLECRDADRRWTLGRFNPLEPEYVLRKE